MIDVMPLRLPPKVLDIWSARVLVEDRLLVRVWIWGIMGLKVLGEGKVERLKRSVGYSNARGNKMKLWMVRATTVVLLWTCLVQLMALGESWGPRVLKGWPSHDSVISGAALDVKLLPVVPDYSGGKKGSFHQMLADANARNNNSGPNVQMPVPGNPVVSMPATNLNMGMDLWNPSAGSRSIKMQPNHSGVSQPGVPPQIMVDQWGQDEREFKRQKKQSNRESARRSRLRKQAECEGLQARVETLNNENHSLRDELQRLSEECGKLTAENDSIKVFWRFFGPEAVSKLDAHLQSRTNEGES
ncbi:putative transcription factor bZIP family [Helianthus annuus]|nr:putative transcription factor bZIP family [Helianthus annuus]